MNDPVLDGIIDFHAHAFPDALAERAIAHLEKEGNARAFLDGRLSSLLASMDSAGIGRAVVCSIATKPDQFAPILNWSRQIASARIVPLPSVHPKGPDPSRIGAASWRPLPSGVRQKKRRRLAAGALAWFGDVSGCQRR